MAVINTNWISELKGGFGFVDEHKTVVRADVDFDCGCGNKINIKGRKTKTGKDKYEFTIKHRNRTQKVISHEPTETQLFDKMLKVSGYVACRFPMGTKKRAVRRVR